MNEYINPELDVPMTEGDSFAITYGGSTAYRPAYRTRRVAGWRGWLLGKTEVVELWWWSTSIYVHGQKAYHAAGYAPSHSEAWAAMDTPAKREWAERNDLRPMTLELRATEAAR